MALPTKAMLAWEGKQGPGLGREGAVSRQACPHVWEGAGSAQGPSGQEEQRASHSSPPCSRVWQGICLLCVQALISSSPPTPPGIAATTAGLVLVYFLGQFLHAVPKPHPESS